MIKDLIQKLKEKIKKWLCCDCQKNVTVVDNLDLKKLIDNDEGRKILINYLKLNNDLLKKTLREN